MMGGGLGIQGTAVTSSAGQSFGNKNYDQVYGMIRQSIDEAGLDMQVRLMVVYVNMLNNHVF